jgi:hypothetical protein
VGLLIRACRGEEQVGWNPPPPAARAAPPYLPFIPSLLVLIKCHRAQFGFGALAAARVSAALPRVCLQRCRVWCVRCAHAVYCVYALGAAAS